MANHRFQLPGKVDAYLAVLNRLYEKREEPVLRELVVNGVVSIHEEWEYDNLDGGTYGHAITLTLPEDLYVKVIDEKDDLRKRIASDMNKLNNVQNEYISEVFVEMELTGADGWRARTGVYRPHMAVSSISAEALRRIWGSHHVRVFLSHKSTVKEDTARLKWALARCGIAAFVAHEDIEPTEEWHTEIERALFSMDAFVALLTIDYHDSNWTDQEVGVALGRGVPLIAVRLGRDPYGLMGKAQGLGGCRWADTEDMALKVLGLLHKRLPDKSRLFECALSVYAASDSFAGSAWNVENLLSAFERLTPDQVNRVVDAYQRNVQNRNSFKGMDILKPLLEKWTGEKWRVVENQLMPVSKVGHMAEDMPF